MGLADAIQDRYSAASHGPLEVGLDAQKGPQPATISRCFYATDTFTLYYSDGENWIAIAGGGGNATAIQGTPVSSAPPMNGDILIYNSITNQYEPGSEEGQDTLGGAYLGGANIDITLANGPVIIDSVAIVTVPLVCSTDGTAPLSAQFTGSPISCPDIGLNSERFGLGSVASGSAAVAVGNTAMAIGNGATAIGTGANASAPSATAIGNGASANSPVSVVIGASSNSSGNAGVIVLGVGSVATGPNQFIAGSNQTISQDVYFGNGVAQGFPNPTVIHGTGGIGAGVSGADLSLSSGVSGDNFIAGGSLNFSVPVAPTCMTESLIMSILGGSGNIMLSGDHDFVPASDNTWNLGTDALRFKEVRAALVVSGDLGFTDEACPYCKKGFDVGDELKLIVTRKQGRESHAIPAHVSCSA